MNGETLCPPDTGLPPPGEAWMEETTEEEEDLENNCRAFRIPPFLGSRNVSTSWALSVTKSVYRFRTWITRGGACAEFLPGPGVEDDDDCAAGVNPVTTLVGIGGETYP